MALFESIHNPEALKKLPADQLPALAQEIRDFLVDSCSQTGGHLGPSLGVVELSIALHRVFESPRDPILFDTGHQAYAHKVLTGRHDFTNLKSEGGLSGYPSRAESEHDFIENSHASTALSYADGMAKANEVRGRTDRTVVAVIGDGALTGGMAWEALNNIAEKKNRRLVVVVNDNGRSYSPTMGGLADHLASLRMTPGYEQALDLAKSTLNRTPVVGQPLYEALHGLKKGLKDTIQPQMMFEDLGLKYLGPIDGHDEPAVEKALRRARDFGGPVIVHVITQKGKGYAPAENHDEDQFHAPGPFDVDTGRAKPGPKVEKWTGVFADTMVELGAEREDIVGITAAMLHPTGLNKFADAYPDRIFDVGIAEQHAATAATGMAMNGLHPVVAVYATFLNRCFDQVLMDAALHRQGVTFCLDRAGVTGNDGASHNGMWDMSILQVVPGLRLAAPRDAARLRTLLREAVAVEDAPTVVRYPKGAVAEELPEGWGLLPDEGTVALVTAPPAQSVTTADWAREISGAVDAGAHVRGSAATGALSVTFPPGTPADRIRLVVDGVRSAEGHPLVLLRAEPHVRAAGIDPWGEVPGLELMRAVKDSLDPGHRLSPGRFAGGI